MPIPWDNKVRTSSAGNSYPLQCTRFFHHQEKRAGNQRLIENCWEERQESVSTLQILMPDFLYGLEAQW